MSHPSFDRARASAVRGTNRGGLIVALAAAQALLLVALLLILGWVSHELATGATRSRTVSAGDGKTAAAAAATSRQSERAPPGWAVISRGAGTGAPSSNRTVIESHHRLLLLLLTLGLAGVVLYYGAAYFQDRAIVAASERLQRELRSDLCRQAMRIECGDGAARGETDLSELLRDRCETLREGLVTWGRTVPRAIFLLPLLVLLALWVQHWIAAAAILLGVLDGLILARIERRTRYEQSLGTDRLERGMQRLLESLPRIPSARALELGEIPGDSTEDCVRALESAGRLRHHAEPTFVAAESLAIAATGTLLLALAGINALRVPPRISVGETVVLAAALACSYAPLVGWFRQRGTTLRADRAAKAIFSYLDREPPVSDVVGAVTLRRLTSSIELVGLSLDDAAGRRLLSEFSARLPARGRVAWIAAEAAPLRALTGALLRLRDPAAGRVLFDGHDLRSVTLHSLRSQIQLVGQEGLVFEGTVADQVTCGDSRYSATEVREAMRRAGADAMLERWPQGLATPVGDGGLPLNPGERLRLGFARALLRRPSVLVIEEPPQGLDEGVVTLLEATYAQFAQQGLLILLPTQLASLRAADRIYLFHQGRLHSEGTHAELLQSSELYRHLHYLWFNPFRTTR